MQYHLPDYFLTDLVSTVAFGIVAILLLVLGYITFDKLTPKLDFDDLLNKGNMALAVEIQRSEEHTSELQSRFDLVCRLLLEKKKKINNKNKNQKKEKISITM